MNMFLRLPHSTRQDNVFLAILAILCATFMWGLGDAIVKTISDDLPLWQMFALRSLLSVPMLIAFLHLRSQSVALLPVAPGWTALRSSMLAAMWLIYYVALPNVPISVAAAVYYTSPLFITLLSPLLVGERVGMLGFFAVIVGFTGVLLIVQPEAGDFNVWAILPLISAVFYALAMLLTRTKCRAEHPLVLVLVMNFAFIMAGAIASLLVLVWPISAEERLLNPFLFGTWKTIGISEWLVLGVLSISMTIAAIGSSNAYQLGPPSVVSTFDFSYVIFAGIWGLILLSEIPTTDAILGTALIIAAGILTVQKKTGPTPVGIDDGREAAIYEMPPQTEPSAKQMSSGPKLIGAQPTIEITIGQAKVVIRGAVDQGTLVTVLKTLKETT